jgi:DNA-binding transcriptional MerR regulator
LIKQIKSFQSPKFAPPIEFVDQATLSPPEGYKDGGLLDSALSGALGNHVFGAQHIQQLQVIQRLQQQRAAMLAARAAAANATNASSQPAIPVAEPQAVCTECAECAECAAAKLAELEGGELTDDSRLINNSITVSCRRFFRLTRKAETLSLEKLKQIIRHRRKQGRGNVCVS